MKCDKEMMLLYAVSDQTWVGKQTFYQQIESALKGGITCLQLREKHMDEESFIQEALEIKALCHQYHVPLLINDNVKVAMACLADGVHVGQDDMSVKEVRKLVGEDMIIGTSCHNVQEALQAQEDGADYLGVGAAFSTSTKLDAKALDHQIYRDITEAVDLPVVAIGGINESNILELSETGVDGVALVSAIFAAENIEQTCIKLKKLSWEMVESCR